MAKGQQAIRIRVITVGRYRDTQRPKAYWSIWGSSVHEMVGQQGNSYSILRWHFQGPTRMAFNRTYPLPHTLFMIPRRLMCGLNSMQT